MSYSAFPVAPMILASELNPWLFATGAVIIGLLSGLIGAALARAIILKGREDRTEIVDAARAASISCSCSSRRSVSSSRSESPVVIHCDRSPRSCFRIRRMCSPRA